MLVILGFGMVLVFMALVMTKRLTPMVALIVVPLVFGLIAGAGWGIGDMVIDAIGGLASTAALLMFAIMYFGLMIDVGLFDPLVRGITRLSGGDPVKIVLGTALLAALVSLDGDGSTTFIVTTSALLPIYLRMGMSPVVLTCVAGLANGTMNIVPWGGPTVRAATALQVSPTDVFVPMLPSLAAGMVVVFLFAWHLGLLERRRLVRAGSGAMVGGEGGQPRWERFLAEPPQSVRAEPDREDSAMADSMLDPNRPTLRPKLFWFNAALTVAVLVLLVLDLVPLPFIFMVGSALALIVNFPRPVDQAKAIISHASSVLNVVSMILAAGVLIGVLDGTGMVDAMANWIVDVIPQSWGPYSAVITAVLSLPLTFFMSNDAFYFGVLPVLAQSAAEFGIDPVQMARASIVGQPFHLQSPLVPAILLLVSLANVDLGDHHKKVLWRAAVVAAVMLAVALLIGVIPLRG